MPLSTDHVRPSSALSPLEEPLRQLLIFSLDDLMYLPDPIAKLGGVVVERHGLTPLESPLLMGPFQLIKGFSRSHEGI